MKKSRIKKMQERLQVLVDDCPCQSLADHCIDGVLTCSRCNTVRDAMELYDSLDEKMAKMNNDYLKTIDDMIIRQNEGSST